MFIPDLDILNVQVRRHNSGLYVADIPTLDIIIVFRRRVICFGISLESHVELHRARRYIDDHAIRLVVSNLGETATVPFSIRQVLSVNGGAMMCLYHKFAANRSRDDRCSNEMEIAAIGVIPSGF